MSHSHPFALLITWTCYGTWLPGDARGYVSNTQSTESTWEPKENTPGTAYRRDDRFTQEIASRHQEHPSVRLTKEQAQCVASTLVEAAQQREWQILRAAVMGNHIHTLITDCPNDGSAVRRILKGVTQAALNRLSGSPHRWWTAGGSDRYLNDESAIEAADRYVAHQEHVLAHVLNMQLVQHESM